MKRPVVEGSFLCREFGNKIVKQQLFLNQTAVVVVPFCS
jgi:hypothetical protein